MGTSFRKSSFICHNCCRWVSLWLHLFKCTCPMKSIEYIVIFMHCRMSCRYHHYNAFVWSFDKIRSRWLGICVLLLWFVLSFYTLKMAVQTTGSCWDLLNSFLFFTGAIGLCWAFIWMLIVHPTPEDHPTISQEEKEYILKDTGTNDATVRYV